MTVSKQAGGIRTTNDTTVGRVIELDDVHGSSGGSNGDTETEEESASHELSDGIGSALDNGADDNNGGTRTHSQATTETINNGADEGKSDNTTDLVHGGDNTSPDTIILDVVLLLEPLVLK